MVFAFVAIDLLVAGSSILVLKYTRDAISHASLLANDIADFALQRGETINAAVWDLLWFQDRPRHGVCASPRVASLVGVQCV